MQRYSYVFAYYLVKKYELTNIIHIKITKKHFDYLLNKKIYLLNLSAEPLGTYEVKDGVAVHFILDSYGTMVSAES